MSTYQLCAASKPTNSIRQVRVPRSHRPFYVPKSHLTHICSYRGIFVFSPIPLYDLPHNIPNHCTLEK